MVSRSERLAKRFGSQEWMKDWSGVPFNNTYLVRKPRLDTAFIERDTSNGEESEFTAGHLPGAIHASRGMLEFRLSSTPALTPRDLKVVLYCKTSGRAALAATTMQEMGYLNVQSIAGGYDAWVAAGRPVVKPELPSFG